MTRPVSDTSGDMLADTKAGVAKAPPLRRWPAFKRWARRNRLAQWFIMAVLAALLWAYVSTMVRWV